MNEVECTATTLRYPRAGILEFPRIWKETLNETSERNFFQRL